MVSSPTLEVVVEAVVVVVVVVVVVIVVVLLVVVASETEVFSFATLCKVIVIGGLWKEGGTVDLG